MTQITTTNTTTNQTSNLSNLTDQAKDTLVSAKGAAYSGAVRSAQFCKDSAVYLGTSTVHVINSASNFAAEALQSAGQSAQNYVSNRSSSEMVLDVTTTACGAFALYSLASYGPSQLANDVKVYFTTRFEQKALLEKVVEGINKQNILNENYIAETGNYIKAATIAAGIAAFVQVINLFK